VKLKVFKKGFNFSQDGPGNRLVLHLQGCNMRCPWCSNPEGIDLKGSLIVNKEMVIDSICPNGALKNGVRDVSTCEKCPTRECITPQNRSKGLFLSYEEIENDELVSLAIDSKAMFFSGGGVTLSGGEPTMQPAAIKDLLKKLKENNINTTVETNGTSKHLEKLMPLIDHLFIDFKVPDPDRHITFTGIPDDVIRKNICIANSIHNDVTIRTPLIAGVNDSAEDIEAFIRFYLENAITRAKFEFLPYFEYGKIKWEQCGMAYIMNDDAHIREETFKAYTNSFKENGLCVVST